MDTEGNLWKPYPEQLEVDFFENLETTRDQILLELKDYVPKYFGIENREVNNEGER